MRLLRAELVKLVRPLTLAATLATVVVVCLLAAMSHETASRQYGIARDNIALLQQRAAPCEAFGLPEAPECERARAQDLADAEMFLRQTRDDTRLVAASQHPVGALGLAAGLLASIPGAFLLLVIGGAAAGGEWTGRTVKSLLLQHGSRPRLLVAKIVVTWLAGVWLLVWAALALVAFGFASQSLFPLDNVLSGGEAWEWAGPRLGRSLVVLLVFAVLGVAAASIARQALGGVLAGALAIVVVNVLARFDASASLSPASWVATWMDFRREPLFLDHVWADRSQFADPAWSLAGLGLLIAVVILAAAADFQRRDVTV